MQITLALIQWDQTIKMSPSLCKRILKTKDLPSNIWSALTEFFSKNPEKLANRYVHGYKRKPRKKIDTSDLF